MSAPKDNKERADSTYVQRRNNRAVDQDRRKHILYGVVGGVIAVLAIALLVWDSGFFQKRSTAVTIDGEDFGPAVVQYYYQQAYVNAYYGAMMGASTFDPNTDPADQMYDEEKGQTWRDYLLEQGIDQLTQGTMLCHAAEEAGYSMTALDESYLQLQLDSLDRSWRTSGNYANLKSYLKTNYGTFMDEDTFRGIAADRVLASSYQQSHQDSLTYTDEEVNAYYAEHTNELDTFGYSVFTIQAAVQEETDEEGNPETEEVTEYTWSLDRTELPQDSQAVDDLVSALAQLNFTECLAYKSAQEELEAMAQLLRSEGYASQASFGLGMGGVLNIVLDPVFIYVLDMGVTGAAVATVISQVGSCAFVLAFLFGSKPHVRITFSGYDVRVMRRVLLIGFTPFAIIAVDNVMIIAMNAVLKRYGGAAQGDMLLTCATIAQSFMLVVTMPLGGITGGSFRRAHANMWNSLRLVLEGKCPNFIVNGL